MSRNEVFDQFTNGTIPAKLNNFGFIQENTSRLGKLLIPKEKIKGCLPMTIGDFDEAQYKSLKPVNYFLLLERGGCPFSVKIKNAMQTGASVLIISDWKEGDPWKRPGQKGFGLLGEEGERPSQLPETEEGVLTAHIPTFEISTEYGEALRKVYGMGEAIYLKANMDSSSDDNTVEVDLWYSSSLDLGLKLANEFAALSYSFTADH
jgi:hypothetical protein